MIKLWERLSSRDFQILFQSGDFFSSKQVSICVKSDFKPSHVGFTIKKGKKSAVERNYIKRLLREAFIPIQFTIPVNWSIVLIASHDVRNARLEDIRLQLLQLIDTASRKLAKKNENNIDFSN